MDTRFMWKTFVEKAIEKVEAKFTIEIQKI